MTSKTCLIAADADPKEGWTDPSTGGAVRWQTIFSGDRTPTDALTCGMAHLTPGAHLAPHRHTPAEIYHAIEGTAVVTVDGDDIVLKPGDTLFIPSLAEHTIRNDGDAPFRWFYVFPTDSFTDVDYRFS